MGYRYARAMPSVEPGYQPKIDKRLWMPGQSVGSGPRRGIDRKRMRFSSGEMTYNLEHNRTHQCKINVETTEEP